MMYLLVEESGRGLHPSETVVTVQTANGVERLVMPRQAISNRAIEVGYPIKARGDDLLIELPRETQSGAWRVWVNKGQLFEPEPERKSA
jgi:hypothetical protein